ncbi:DUF2254 domain-containing protein [Halobacillus shinanisalinarum]|uniref:DUF2254 domain-containing protein n=1 Tax=Halobacillus shinanisalinarum TaxID=2932258 RepID=A0ABY4GVK4_9BACI|nr:DUF2254 domain-containing protein [Halobacillus shinanisalinarum]UOQ92201.1 DUF2254 domain-containing protein [Halobacillus shinanisalinarum]
MNKREGLSSKIQKYRNMSKREKWHQIYSNLWVTPIMYAGLFLLLFALTVWGDLKMEFGDMMPSILSASYKLTETILSTLTAGLLSLNAFTFYGVLTALTTFAGQFSPRILKNFMMTKVTQRTLGIFNGSFLYVLLCLLFLNGETVSQYTLIPVTATFLTALCLGSFAIFINHIVNWLQVSNMEEDMKRESIDIIDNSLLSELDPYRVEEEGTINGQLPEYQGHQISIDDSGYLQTIDFVPLIEEACKDDLIIRLEYKVGNFVFGSTPLLTYWKKEGNTTIDEFKYNNMFHIGDGQTEIQDIEFSINKFVEIAIRALGNDDPTTATGTIYEIGDLLINISQKAKFTPYLTDKDSNLRLILQNLKFDDYLYIGFASTRHYARDNVVITIELLKVLNAIAQGVSKRDYPHVWDFAVYTASGFEYEYMHHLDNGKFYNALFNIAKTTGHEEDYRNLTEKTPRKANEVESLVMS